MDFTLTEDRRMLSDSLSRFLADWCDHSTVEKAMQVARVQRGGGSLIFYP